MLSQEALLEFKRIYAEEEGIELPDDFALELAVALLGLFDVVYKPLKKEWVNEYE
ncbi:MAG: hypothetical protein V4681_01345 [Patescibacteria group bacterium]